MKHSEKANASDGSGAGIGRNVAVVEMARAHGHYSAVCTGPIESRRAEYNALREQISWAETRNIIMRLMTRSKVADLRTRLAGIPIEEKWRDTLFMNAVLPEGKNFVLDKGFAGSSFTAAWYIGIYNSGYTVLGSETYAAKGGTENTNYSQSTRPAAAWSAASAGSKAFSSAAVFSINGAGGTIAGCFLCAGSNTKGDSTSSVGVNVMWSIGAFSGGNKTVASGDTLNVSYTTGL